MPGDDWTADGRVVAIADLRRDRKAALRREAREAWASKFEIYLRVAWPRGVLGWLWAAGAMIAPIGFVLLGGRLARLILRRYQPRDESPDPGDAA